MVVVRKSALAAIAGDPEDTQVDADDEIQGQPKRRSWRIAALLNRKWFTIAAAAVLMMGVAALIAAWVTSRTADGRLEGLIARRLFVTSCEGDRGRPQVNVEMRGALGKSCARATYCAPWKCMPHDCRPRIGNIQGRLLQLDAQEEARRAGARSSIATPEECCSACRQLPGCSSWVFCSNREGCGAHCSPSADSSNGRKAFRGCQGDRWPYQLCSLKAVPEEDMPFPRELDAGRPGFISGLLHPEDPVGEAGTDADPNKRPAQQEAGVLEVGRGSSAYGPEPAHVSPPPCPVGESWCQECLASPDPWPCIECFSYHRAGNASSVHPIPLEHCSQCLGIRHRGWCMQCLVRHGLVMDSCGACLLADDTDKCFECWQYDAVSEDDKPLCAACAMAKLPRQCTDCVMKQSESQSDIGVCLVSPSHVIGT